MPMITPEQGTVRGANRVGLRCKSPLRHHRWVNRFRDPNHAENAPSGSQERKPTMNHLGPPTVYSRALV